MLASLLAAVAQALLGFLRGWLGDARAAATSQSLGAQTAATETLATVAEIADARASLAAEPDDPDVLIKRLRDAASAARGPDTAKQ